MKRKTALITGASRGIGRAAAFAFAEGGYDLVLNCSRSVEALAELSQELKSRFFIRTACCPGDVGDFGFVSRMFAQAEAFCGGIDVLVNNAGISRTGLLSDMACEEFDRVLRVNLASVFACCRHAIPYMVSQKSGKILNVSSVWGVCGASCEAAYSASKGGVNALTMALAKELAPSNVQVNAVAFGAVDTDMNGALSREERKALEDEIPAGRFASPAEAGAFLFQLAGAPAYLTGQVIRFDGGWI